MGAEESMRPSHGSSSSHEPLLQVSDTEWLSQSPRELSPLRKSAMNQRSGLVLVGALVTFASFAAAAVFFLLLGGRPLQVVDVDANQDAISDVAVGIPPNDTLTSAEYLIGQPTESFRDNLRNDTKYITSWVSGGWTNDVMSYFNLIYLSLITDRVPVIPPFAPSHVGAEAGYLNFSQVFDISRLSASIEKPVLEWWQVKDVESTHVDDLGCWSIWAMVNKDENRPRPNIIEKHLELDVSYTTVPDSAKLKPNEQWDWHASFWGLASITFPKTREAIPQAGYPSNGHGHTLPPDEHMSCFDFPYYVSALNTFEYNFDYSPAWRYVATHARWNLELEDLSQQYLRRALGVTEEEPVPPFIAMHIRHGDFGGWCQDVPKDECFAPLSAYARRVLEVQDELRERKGLEVSRVLVMSDENDPEWREALRQLGWNWVDHEIERTEELYGKWYPPILDAVFQSSGVGFVGTDRSTMTLLAQRRVEDWFNGATRAVKWGFKDADAH